MIILKDTANRVIPPFNIIHNMARPFKNGFIFLDAGYGIFEINQDSAAAHLVITRYRAIARMVIGEGRKLFFRVAEANGGVTYYYTNGKWIKTPHLLDSLDWSDIFYDKTDETYWVGIFKAMIHYDKEFHKIRSYSDEEGLIDNPLTIIPDGRGNVWFNNDRKIIAILNIKTGVVTTLSEQDGYQRQSYDWTSPQAKEAGGRLYFVGNYLSSGKIGLDRITPDKFVHPPSLVYLNSLKINQNDFPISTSVNNLQELSLRYFENKISLETGIINYYSVAKSHIRYKLEAEGKNEEWEYAPAYYTIRYEGLPPAKYKLTIQSSNAANEFNGPLKTLLINISPAFWNTWWFRAIALLFLVDLIYSLVRWRLRKKFELQLQHTEKEKQIAELKQKTVEMEMQALRAQMNPHFIFNSLNSINRFILQNNRAQASEYLTKFSKLVRLILQNSQASLISLESELQALELYLELEALRFDYHFDYKISVPKDLDIEALRVPPLIIQPYIENAIWHGLMHKEDRGQLDIEVSEEGDHLYFKIADNGVGRKKACSNGKQIGNKT